MFLGSPEKKPEDSEMLGLTIAHFLPLSVGRGLNLGVGIALKFSGFYSSMAVFTGRVKLRGKS